MVLQFFPRLQDIASPWHSSFVMPACCSSSCVSNLMAAAALLCSAAVMASWHSSSWSIMPLCCGDCCMAMHPAQGSTVPGPTCTVCQILSSWSALHGPTPPSHPPGMPDASGAKKIQLGACMYRDSTQMCFIHSAFSPPFLCLDLQDSISGLSKESKITGENRRNLPDSEDIAVKMCWLLHVPLEDVPS